MSIRSINDVNLPRDLFKDMSVEFLKTLDSQDEATFYEFFQQLSLEDVKRARQRCEMVQDENRELALQNSDLEPSYQQRRDELQLLVIEAQELKEDYDKDFQELRKYQSRSELATLKKQLQEATKNSEQTSEDFAADFVSGKSSLSVEEFMEGLIAQRSEYWLRKVKLEKFDELSKNRQKPRPVPVPRTKRPSEPTPTPSYPPSSQEPMHSLPVGGRNPPYPPGGYPRRASDGAPSSSLPPYPVANPGGMPRPSQQPFPAAAYTQYRPPQPQPGYPRGPPPRPAPYAQHTAAQPPRPLYGQQPRPPYSYNYRY